MKLCIISGEIVEPMDVAFAKFNELITEVTQKDYWESVISEADTKMKIIDRIFIEVL